ncbi:MAG: hypothetical protein WBN10_10210 [Polyangiales bacterium]
MNTTHPAESNEPKKLWRAFAPRGITSGVLIRLALAALLVTAGTACKHNKKATTTVTRRAGFDLACPTEELKLNVVDTEGARKMASQIAVRGCEQKAVYVYYPDSDTWTIDGIVTPLKSDYEVPPPIDKGRGKRGDKNALKAEKRGKMESGPPAPVEAAPVEAPAVEPDVTE